ncbi:MAG TPA: hypothetical protein VHN74_19825 [Candidatus Angelobacter sp.]|jgi:hypothetical protein|nr:hypothetical protein [Candidatus Angelobacter sp.]
MRIPPDTEMRRVGPAPPLATITFNRGLLRSGERWQAPFRVHHALGAQPLEKTPAALKRLASAELS